VGVKTSLARAYAPREMVLAVEEVIEPTNNDAMGSVKHALVRADVLVAVAYVTK
jgi:hypothetical protein